MANRAYVSAWTTHDSNAARLETFGRLLETVPFSASWKGFTSAVVRAVGLAETPLREWDLRSRPCSADETIELIREEDSADVAYEVGAVWDLWTYDAAENRWTRGPQRLEIVCYGEEFEDGIAVQDGDFLIDVGLEHLFTGHGQLLGTRARGLGDAERVAAHPDEAAFLAAMSEPERLREYHEKTQENIQALFRWMREAEAAVPLERYRLWSEGEDNLEARLDEILAVR
jgi:hypothetical protein